MKKVVVGSTSVHKIEAVKEALLRLGVHAEVVGIKIESGVNEQPVGFKETCGGALHRAQGVKLQYPAYTRIGIESGILRELGVTIDFAVVVVITADKHVYVATSPGVRFPEESVYKANKLGFEKTTVGEVIAAKLGGDKTDQHSMLTHGRVSRKETLIEGIRLAFAQVPNLEKI